MANTDFDHLRISDRQAARLAAEYFGISGQATALTGEVDFNYRIQTPTGESYVLKISRPDEDPANLDFQEAILDHLNGQPLPFAVPRLQTSKTGQRFAEFTDDQGQNRRLRLQNWISGRLIDKVAPKDASLLREWGKSAGLLSKHLQGFDHPYAHRDFRWDPMQLPEVSTLFRYFRGEEEKELAGYFLELFQKEIPQLRAQLRYGVNYNDAHELNLLTERSPQGKIRVCGVIDFGDAVYTATVCELAITCAYAAMEQPDPLAAIRVVVQGYHSIFPLEEREVQALFPLIISRLLLTVTHAAHSRVQEPDNAYLSISEQQAWAVLKKFRNIAPAFAHYSLREACAWAPCPQRAVFDNWLQQTDPDFAAVVPLSGKKILPLDLAVGGEVLGNNTNFSTYTAMNRTIFRHLQDRDADLGVGGYLEVRPFYSTDAYRVEGLNGPQWRTVHLGLDLWDQAGTPVYAPLAGTVHSFRDNAAERDYGPAIILEHKVDSELTFYTLYGHLSRDSLPGLQVGQKIAQGQEIARIGPAPENGNWAPHLHFQVMLDTLGLEGDFPGVAFPQERAIWASLCPDPQELVPDLKDFDLRPGTPTPDDLLSRRRQVLGSGLSISYHKPLLMARGYGPYLYDHTARRYLDTVNNVAHVGHEHPRVVAAAQHQMGLLNTNTRYLHPAILDFAEVLLTTLPPELCVVHLVNSGSEANELALRMAETVAGTRNMIAVEIGYHGNTGRTIDVSSYKFDGKGGKGAPSTTQVVPMPDIYRGKHRDPTTAGEQYAGYVSEAVAHFQNRGEAVGGFIAESILSCGGQIVLPEGYLRHAYAAVRKAGGVCIADEVQVGFGRVGSHFWGFELQGVVPDIVTMGKPIGNGHPLGAVVCTRAVAEAFANGMEFFNTFGGNPVSSRIGRTVLEVIQEEGLQENALETGQYLLCGLQKLQSRHPIIGDVRGHGLFLGFELVKDRTEKTPAPKAAAYLSNRMRELGILMSTDGPDYNVMKIKPPMCFYRQHADQFLHYLDRVLGEDIMQS